MSVREETIADLETIVVDAPEGAPAVVILHGYGAHFRDLFPLYQMLRPQSDCAWYFPNGPEKIFTGMPDYGRAWFPLDPERLNLLAAQKDYQKVAQLNYAGMDEMTETLHKFLQTISLRHPNIVLGGFSQGAILSTNLALTTAFPLQALTVFSGSLAKRDQWVKAATKRQNLRIFQSHGFHDTVLPYALAEQLRDLFTQAGLPVTFRGFEGMHEIPLPVLEAYRSFLDQLLISLGD